MLDWDYIRAHPANLARLIEHQRIRTTPLPGGDTCTAERLTLDDGQSVFAKSLPGAPPGFFAAEASGLRWLAAASAVPVPEVVAVTDDVLLLTWVDRGTPSVAAAGQLGRELAGLHRSGAEGYGAPWPGFIGRLPMSNLSAPSWTEFYAERRVLPFVRLAVERGALSVADAAVLEAALGRVDVPDEPPARLHGDLWSGNVLWAADGTAYLVDPAAHGGHRETDLAMLALFGLPHLGVVLAAYDEVYPLVTGWRERVPLHQLHPLAVHTALFGGGYGAQLVAAASRYSRVTGHFGAPPAPRDAPK